MCEESRWRGTASVLATTLRRPGLIYERVAEFEIRGVNMVQIWITRTFDNPLADSSHIRRSSQGPKLGPPEQCSVIERHYVQYWGFIPGV